MIEHNILFTGLDTHLFVLEAVDSINIIKITQLDYPYFNSLVYSKDTLLNCKMFNRQLINLHELTDIKSMEFIPGYKLMPTKDS